jgi:hypothetical protein
MPTYHIVDEMDHVAYISRPGECDYDDAEGSTPAEAVLAWAGGFEPGEGPQKNGTLWVVDVATREATRVRLTVAWGVTYRAAELPPEPTP